MSGQRRRMARISSVRSALRQIRTKAARVSVRSGLEQSTTGTRMWTRARCAYLG